MAIELVKTNYFIREHRSQEICDSPCIGASEHVGQKITNHGPYPIRQEAEIQLSHLQDKLRAEGWHHGVDGCWRQGDYDLWLSIERQVENLGELSLRSRIQVMKSAELMAKVKENKKQQTVLDAAREEAYQKYQELSTKYSSAFIGIGTLYSVIPLDSNYFAKVEAHGHEGWDEPYTVVDLYHFNDGKLGALTAWDAVTEMTPIIQEQVKKINTLMKQWKENQISWPWDLVDESTFYHYEKIINL